MELFNPNIYINFMKYRGLFFLSSVVLLSASIFIWFSGGDEKYSIDFLGGHQVTVKFDDSTDIAKVRESLSKSGLDGVSVQSFDLESKTFSIKIRKETSQSNIAETIDKKDQQVATANSTELPVDKVKRILGKEITTKFNVVGSDYVGPIVGDQIRKDGLIALVISLIGMMIYITIRFEWGFALGGIVAILHDVFISAAAVVLSGREVGVAVLAALLTIVGYSINDTIVVFDRVRENRNKGTRLNSEYFAIKNKPTFAELINLSISQTLSRTFMTGALTFVVTCCLAIFGTGDVSDLAFTFSIGIIVGVYSSVFIASVIALFINDSRKKG